jgi:predicted nucleic acid-binding protein
MIILDTNVISELWRPRPNTRVLDWFNDQPAHDLFLCTPVLAELYAGMRKMPEGARRNRLSAAIDELESKYRVRILSFDPTSAREYGRLTGDRQRKGQPIRVMDALIASVALANAASLATRDGGFRDLGLDLIDPFEYGAA